MTSDDLERLLLEQVQQIVTELHRRRAASLQVHLDSELNREWGLDSLGRVELISRLERAFDLQLPEQVLSTAATPRDLLQALRGSALPRFSLKALPHALRHQAQSTVPLPGDAQTLTEVMSGMSRRIRSGHMCSCTAIPIR